MLVSFSGMDGAGKSTQIAALCSRLHQNGVSFCVVAFWDQVATLKRIREGSSHSLFKGDKGVGTPERPVNRRDKNIQSWYMTLTRLFLYFLDAIALRTVARTNLESGVEVVIFDRYLYDELANLPSQNPITRAYVRVLLRFVPRPDIAYLLDADPVHARARKPEYPLDFLGSNRTSYLRLSELAGMAVIPPLTVGEASERVLEELRSHVPLQFVS
jgi:thymidylate kinase